MTTPTIGAHTHMAGRHRDQRLDSAITVAGTRVLRNGGYQAFSIDRVATELGIARSTIYARWQNKADLLDGLLAKRLTRRLPKQSSALRPALIELLAQDLALAAGPEGRATAHLLLDSQDPNRPAAARVQKALATRRETYLDRLATHGVNQQIAPTLVDLALSSVWGASVTSEVLGAVTADQLTNLILEELRRRATHWVKSGPKTASTR